MTPSAAGEPVSTEKRGKSSARRHPPRLPFPLPPPHWLCDPGKWLDLSVFRLLGEVLQTGCLNTTAMNPLVLLEAGSLTSGAHQGLAPPAGSEGEWGPGRSASFWWPLAFLGVVPPEEASLHSLLPLHMASSLPVLLFLRGQQSYWIGGCLI